MKLKAIIDEDFVNYKKPSMFLIFPSCDFKCDKENGNQICQNCNLIKEPDIDVDYSLIIARYLMNDITKAIVLGGLEPFYDPFVLKEFISYFRERCDDDIVIYTGYKESELLFIIDEVVQDYKNIIIKYGRFIPNQKKHYDEILGVELASNNQYAKIYNYEGDKWELK